MTNTITAIAAAALAVGITTYGVQAFQTAEEVAQELGSLQIETVKKAYGISDLVYNCVEDVLGTDADNIIRFIETEAQTTGTDAETETATQIKQCIYQDPFGWHGTENEWAIELLNTDEWK
jgi:hypothetical protein